MCLINFQFQQHPNYKLIVAANRDEFYERPTEPAHFWEDHPDILAGRDLLQMGTWLGITKKGRFASLTNYRDKNYMTKNKISRGEIVRRYLAEDITPVDYLNDLSENKQNYAGFNLIIGNPDQLFYFNNIDGNIIEITPGIHGLSNHFLNTPWPKVTRGKRMLHDYVMSHSIIHYDALFEILLNAELADDEKLPETGIDIELERQLSPLFIKTDKYGTRCSTVLLVDNENNVTFVERTFENGNFKSQKHFSF